MFFEEVLRVLIYTGFTVTIFAVIAALGFTISGLVMLSIESLRKQ